MIEDHIEENSLHSPILPPRRAVIWNSWGVCIIYILVVILVLFVAVVFASKQALPGQILYTAKVYGLERGLSYTKFTDSARVNYATTRLEARLNELILLQNDTATATPEVLATIADLAVSHVHDAVAIANTSLSLKGEEKINALEKLETVSRATESLAGANPEFFSIEKNLQNSRMSAGVSLRSTVEQFASTSPKDITDAYILSQVHDVSSSIQNVAQGSNAQRTAMSDISNMSNSLSKGETANAILYILKAKEAIAVDKYIFDSERGPVNGAEVAPGVAPEGS